MSRAGRRTAATVTALLLSLSATACADQAASTDGSRVAAAFYPLAFVAERVAGERALVTNLTSPGGEPHDLELTVNEAVEVADADLVVLLEGFQPAVDDTVATTAEGRVLDAGTVVALQPAGEHADEDETELEAGHDHQLDPHFWLDPLRMADLADAVAEELAEIAPDHAAEYSANAADLRAELTALDSAYTEGLADCTRDTVVVSHDAFGYLARYGLHFEAINGLSPDAEPTPADLARLEQLVRDEGVTTVFSETLASPKLAETLAAEAGVSTDVLDPIEGLADHTAHEDYLTLMGANLAALEEANGC